MKIPVKIYFLIDNPIRSVGEIRALETLHRQFSIDGLEDVATDYLLHQNDYVTVFDFTKNRPKAVYATIDPKNVFENTRRFSTVRMDPRTHSWSTAEVPLFPTDLASRLFKLKCICCVH